MNELKKTLNKKPVGQTVPDSLDGKVTPETVLERFRECYQELFKSAGSEDAMTGIKAKLEQMIDASSAKEVEKVTGHVVKLACSKMKPGKGDVTEAYSSDVFLHAPDYLFELLAAVFRSYLTHGTVTLQILSCDFLQLLKGGLKSPGKFDS